MGRHAHVCAGERVVEVAALRGMHAAALQCKQLKLSPAHQPCRHSPCVHPVRASQRQACTCLLLPPRPPACLQNFLALIPLALLLGDVTEDLAVRLGDTVGGLLNATFGNVSARLSAHGCERRHVSCWLLQSYGAVLTTDPH